MHQRDEATHELVSAYLDGELTRDERTRVEQLLTSSPDHRQVIEEMRALGDGLRQLPTWQLDPEFAARVMDRARAVRNPGDGWDHGGQCVGVRSRAGGLFQGGPHRRLIGGTASAAAVLLLAWGTGWIVWHRPGGAGQLARTDHQAEFELDSAPVPRGGRAPDETPQRAEPAAADDSAPSVMRPVPSPDDSVSGSPPLVPERTGRGNEVVRSGRVGVTDPATDTVARVAPMEGNVPAPQEVSPAGPVTARPPSLVENGPPGPVPAAAAPAEQLLLVMDVVLTPVGKQRAAFERALAAQGITYDAAVPVGAELEKRLLASRFFDPLVVPETPLPDVDQQADDAMSLVYVITRAGQVDDLWQLFDTDSQHFQQVTMDLALRPEDLSMFKDLRRAVDRQDASGVTAADAQRRQRRAAAHQLLLAPGWRGTPAQKLKGLGAMAGLVPDWLLGLPPERAGASDRLGSKDAEAAGAPPPQLREEVEAEILFVVRHNATTAGD